MRKAGERGAAWWEFQFHEVDIYSVYMIQLAPHNAAFLNRQLPI